METANIPEIGTEMKRAGGEITYRVIERTGRGVRVEATVSEAVPMQAGAVRQPRRLTYAERFVSLAYTEASGKPGFIDSRWNAWIVVSK